jgi:hypothetical protein
MTARVAVRDALTTPNAAKQIKALVAGVHVDALEHEQVLDLI